MTRTLILSGAGTFSDPWHPFGATSAELAGIARGLGHEVEMSEDIEARVCDLRNADLVVVNTADGPPSEARSNAHSGVRRFLQAGGSILAMHVGASTLLGLPEWSSVTGMAWIDGVSTHLPVGPASVLVHPERDVIANGVASFRLVDECYLKLKVRADVLPFLVHEHAGQTYPLAWSRSYLRSNIVVDVLGHGVESYQSPQHRQLLAQALAWLASPGEDLR